MTCHWDSCASNGLCSEEPSALSFIMIKDQHFTIINRTLSINFPLLDSYLKFLCGIMVFVICPQVKIVAYRHGPVVSELVKLLIKAL